MVDQQFCLRWNNHKSTLISVFDTLLENNVLVDCTLAAEGQYLKAHKVVLCACSPYLERILSQHTERHPILILKDVKYQELKCMMDYMYKGEVNISQEQLETFLKAAESLQIKGLTDSGSKDDYRVANHSKRQEQTRKPPSIQLVSSTSPVSTPYSHSSALNELNVRQTSTSNVDAPLDASPNSRDRSLSPVPRKRKRPRRPSQTDSEHFDSASETPVQIQSTPMINVPLANQILSTSTSSTINDGTDQSLTVADIARFTGVLSTENIKKEKIESQPDNLIVPKTEFIDDVNEDGVEDLTLEEDIENMDGGPGPSHSSENSNQGYGWSIAGERSTDEIFSSQDLANTAQDNQGTVAATKKAPSAENAEEGRYKKSKEHEFPSESEKSPKSAIPGSGCLSVKSSDGKVLTLQQLRNVYCEGEVDPVKISKRSAATAAATVANASTASTAGGSSVESLLSKIGSQKQSQKPSAVAGRAAPSTTSCAAPITRFPAPVAGQQKRSGKINISVENLSSFISKSVVRPSTPLPLPSPPVNEFAPAVLPSKLNQVKLIDLQKLPPAVSPSKQISRMPAAPNETVPPIAMVSQLRSISLTPVGALRLEASSGSAAAALTAPLARVADSAQMVRNVPAGTDNGSHVVGVGNSSCSTVAAAGSLVQLSQLPRSILDSGTLSIIPALTKNVPVEETAQIGSISPTIRLPVTPALDGASVATVVCGKIPGNVSCQIISSECSTLGSATTVPATIATTVVGGCSANCSTSVTAAASSVGISSTGSNSCTGSCTSSGSNLLPQKVIVSEIGFGLQPISLCSTAEKTAPKVQEGSGGRKYMNWACRNKCGMVFTTKEDWLKHCKYDCEKRFRYNCEVCGKPFITNKRLKKHMNNHHSDANPPMDIPLDVPPTSSESQQSN